MRQMSWQHTSDRPSTHPSTSLPILVSRVSSRDPLQVDQQRVTVAEWQHLMYRLDALETDLAIERSQSRRMAPAVDRPTDRPANRPMNLPMNSPVDPPENPVTDPPLHQRSDRSTPARPARNHSPMVQTVLLLGKWLSLALLGFVLAVYISLSWNQMEMAQFLGDTFLNSWKPLLSLVIGVSAIAISRESLRTS